MKKCIMVLLIFWSFFLLIAGCSMDTDDGILLQTDLEEGMGSTDATPLLTLSNVKITDQIIEIPSLRLGKFIPPRVGSGDRDFHGNGPKIEITVYIGINESNPKELWATTYMHGKETKSDWTEVKGWRSILLLRASEPLYILTDTVTHFSYTDNDHGDDVFGFGSMEAVKTLIITGDTSGDEAGTRTGVTVITNPIRAKFIQY